MRGGYLRPDHVRASRVAARRGRPHAGAPPRPLGHPRRDGQPRDDARRHGRDVGQR